MNIYDALKTDHKKVSALLDQLLSYAPETSFDSSSSAYNPVGKLSSEWKSLIDQICDELIPHSRAEEALFYNAIRANDSAARVIMHSYAEHATAEAELRSLQAMALIDVKWLALAKKLREDILHHVAEEESKVFAAAKNLLSENDAEMIEKAFQKLKPSIKEQSITENTLDLVANLLPPQVVSNFKSGYKDLMNIGKDKVKDGLSKGEVIFQDFAKDTRKAKSKIGKFISTNAIPLIGVTAAATMAGYLFLNRKPKSGSSPRRTETKVRSLTSKTSKLSKRSGHASGQNESAQS